MDNLWFEQGYLEYHVGKAGGDANTPGIRKLTEAEPYGKAKVQGDLLELGPDPVLICIADTGGARRHPDLRNQKQMKGSNRYSKADNTKLKWRSDVRGHGTHVCGTIIATPDNNIGIQGIAPGNPMFITRALDDKGTARESDIMESVEQCAEAGAKIISMSLGGGGITTMFKDYFNELYYDRGILIVSAAGNNGDNVEKWPGALPSVISGKPYYIKK